MVRWSLARSVGLSECPLTVSARSRDVGAPRAARFAHKYQFVSTKSHQSFVGRDRQRRFCKAGDGGAARSKKFRADFGTRCGNRALWTLGLAIASRGILNYPSKLKGRATKGEGRNWGRGCSHPATTTAPTVSHFNFWNGLGSVIGLLSSGASQPQRQHRYGSLGSLEFHRSDSPRDSEFTL